MTERVVIVWAGGQREHVDTDHPYARRMLVPVWVDTRYARVEFTRETSRYPLGWQGPCESWWTSDDEGRVVEFRFREIERELPQPERWLQ